MTVLRLARHDAVRGLSSRRWLLVPLVFLVAGWISLDAVVYDVTTRSNREVNVWDGPLSFVTSQQLLLFVCLIGFIFVVGDLTLNQLQDGTSSYTALRVPSRFTWWAAKVVAVGLLALVYAAVGVVTVLLVSAIQLPVAWAPSPMAQAPFDGASSLYPLVDNLPMPVLLTAVTVHVAIGLWVCGTVAITASLVWTRSAVPFSVGVLVAVVSWQLWVVGAGWDGIGVALPDAGLNYAVHFPMYFEGAVTRTPRPAWMTIASIATWLVASLIGGAWRLRRMPL